MEPLRTRHDFAEVLAAARVMASFDSSWYVAGGWAIDLFLRRKTREHTDVDMAISRLDQVAIHRHFSGWRIEKVVPASDSRLVRQPWPEGEWLSLPVHEIHAHGPADQHLEFLLLERDRDHWAYRRDPRVRLRWDGLAVKTALGVRALAPEVALLFKAKGTRESDQRDFDEVLPHLSPPQRTRLREALQTSHPGHRWLEALTQRC